MRTIAKHITNPFAFKESQLVDYLVDASQRTVLYWDTMRRRGNQYIEHMEDKVPHVLQFEAELVMSGRTLPEPVNYGLVRIIPPDGALIDERKRPFVIVDPRAGHGPGIGGFKAESEIGVAMEARHPCYFIGFLPMPEPGQTIESVMRAEAAFIKKVIELQPEAEGKPVVIGNCQAGWAVMMLAAAYPELCGPIILAGAPISYWDGVRGVNPMRYTGGLLGGSWLTALTGDMGNGKFDGAWLVQNFENLNPANTLWSKQYNQLRDRMDRGGPREAIVRSFIYVRMPENAPDERGFAALNRLRRQYASDMTLEELKTLVREQVFMLLIDENRALETIPALLKGHEDKASDLLEIVRNLVTAKGKLSEPLKERFKRVESIFVSLDDEAF